LASNQRRSEGRYLAALQRLIRSEPPQSHRSTEQSSDQRQEAQVLWQAVRRLSHADQQVIYLRYFLDLSVEETAGAMQVAQGTVKSRLHRALDRLREVIGHEFPSLKEWNDERHNA
jgi:RNA polymerase sigma-70 factor (ECF subfamily)